MSVQADRGRAVAGRPGALVAHTAVASPSFQMPPAARRRAGERLLHPDQLAPCGHHRTGIYCFTDHRSTAITSSDAIDIQANNVRLDFNSFKLGASPPALVQTLSRPCVARAVVACPRAERP